MKSVVPAWLAIASGVLLCTFAQDRPMLEAVPDSAGFRLQWRLNSSGTLLRYQLEQSTDLQAWAPIGVPIRSGATNQTVSRPVASPLQFAFYRVTVTPESRDSALAQGGEDVFGYSDLFNQELAKIGQITPEQFRQRYQPDVEYVSQIDWDPTSAEFWNAFDVDPAVYNRNLIRDVDDLRQFNFRLNPDELAVFKKYGFVVSERLGAYSCGEVYNQLWIDDLPVFITTDSILHAWHRSYDMMLAEIESTILSANIQTMLEGMAARIASANTQVTPALRDSVLDADYYLTVARSLLKGITVASNLGQDDRVQRTLQAIAGEKLDTCFQLFGSPRAVDFSQFKPRGHYNESYELQLYFKTVMWLGRIDLRIAGGPFQDSLCEEPHHANLRDLGTTIVLHELLRDSGQFQKWEQSEELVSTFVGWTDSMTFRELGQLLQEAGITNLASVKDTNTLAQLQDRIELGTLGMQTINGDFFVAPFSDHPAALPQSFTVLGQKFVLDSWALSQVVADRIFRVEDGQTNLVMRRMPSALDVAFSVLGNDQIVPELVERMNATNAATSTNYAIKYRDGWPYQHNLAAVREMVEQHPPSAWSQNVYMGWLDTLRQLSPPLAAETRMPTAMRTRAWAMKDLNTQLASWTELRHDTILYAKQSYTDSLACSYPKGFVEPRSDFWRRLQFLAEKTGVLIARTDYASMTNLQQKQIVFLTHFADVCRRFLVMSEKELAQVPFSDAELDFISTTLVGFRGYVGYWTVQDGWYPKLFYRTDSLPIPFPLGFDQVLGATRWDPLITDVHTDPPCGVCDDPGAVLHEATGNVNLLLITIDNGTNRCVYAGPVLSHYEFALPSSVSGEPQRLSDQEWQGQFAKDNLADPSSRFPPISNGGSFGIPKPPRWTKESLVERKP